MTYNLLSWDNPSNLPFPKEVLDLLPTVKWDEISWNTVGFPVHGAKYSITNNALYFEEWPDGSVEVKKEDFTGEAYVAAFFRNPDPQERSYHVVFNVKFLNGVPQESEVVQVKPWETKEYDKILNDITENVNRTIALQSKWWYRYLYMPYGYIVRYTAMLICWILNGLVWLVTKIALFLTPI
jgi:hypothetical protein